MKVRLMRLTSFSDYSLRLLMYAASHPDRLITIEEAARVYGISRAHLMKVANLLTAKGYLHAVRGRAGGLRLNRPPAEINLGALVRVTEHDFALVECLGTSNTCPIAAHCRLKRIMAKALQAFLEVFDHYSLADLAARPGEFSSIVGLIES